MRNVLILIVIGACCACTPVYLPNSRSVPIFEQGGELALDGYVSGSGFDLNTGVSVSDHVAIIGNFSYSKRDNGHSNDYHKHKFGELGVGYFKKASDKFQTGFYGGFGGGEGTSVDEYVFISQNVEKTTGYYSRAFLQANFAFTPGIVRLGGAMRLSFVDFNRFETTSSSYERSRSATFAEPTFFLKVGDPIHFNLQAGLNLPMDENIAFDYRFLHLSIGFGAKIGL